MASVLTIAGDELILASVLEMPIEKGKLSMSLERDLLVNQF